MQLASVESGWPDNKRSLEFMESTQETGIWQSYWKDSLIGFFG
jgi:hypothetical protein